jgi:hypothetical protein
MSLRAWVTVVGVAVIAAALVGAGRWEGRRAADSQNAAMRRILAATGSLDSTRLYGFREGPPACFAYRVGTNPFALQLCFDSEGRLVETVDRRGDVPVYSSLMYEDKLATTRVAPAEISRLLRLAVAAS